MQRSKRFAGAKEAWRRDGWLRLPGFLAAAEMAPLKAACDRALAGWEAAGGDRSEATNMAYLTEPRYFAGAEAELAALLEFVAAPALLALLGEIGAAPALFHNTQYFFEQPGRAWAGRWHRDSQFLAENDEIERRRMAEGFGVHVRVAFLPDDRLELVPGSHARWDSPAERAARAGGEAVDLPEARRIALAPGDLLVFHAWSIHRGHYGPTPRRTLDVIHHAGGPCRWAPPPATCFGDAALLARLSPGARAYYERFVAAYADSWNSSRPISMRRISDVPAPIS